MTRWSGAVAFADALTTERGRSTTRSRSCGRRTGDLACGKSARTVDRPRRAGVARRETG
jgi:hypothetical protein